MEQKTREEIALMSKEELEVLVLHQQEREQTLEKELTDSDEMRMYYYRKVVEMEARLDVLMNLLKTWGVGK